MSNPRLNWSRLISILAVVLSVLHTASSQQNLVTSFSGSDFTVKEILRGTDPPPAAINPARVIDGLLKAESEVRALLNQYTFRRDVILQTIGPQGEITGEYIRYSQFVFDDRGRRLERVLFHPPSTIHGLRITKEDIQDLAGAQLLGIDVSESSKYVLNYKGVESVNGRDALAIDLAPAQKPDPNRMRERFFVGRLWIDPHTLRILKVRGITEPQGRQRFPVFETWREPIDSGELFPSRTKADDILHFATGDFHYRISVRYYDYKHFGSELTITEIDQMPARYPTPQG